MNKQILNQEKNLENFLQNPSLSQVEVLKLSSVAQYSVGCILWQYKETRPSESRVYIIV